MSTLLEIVHSSSRFDRSGGSLLRAMRFYVTKGDIITLTETTRASRTAVLRQLPGFGLVKGHGIGGAGDPAIVYRKDRLTVEHVETWKVADPAPRLKGVNIAGPMALFRDQPSGLLIAVLALHYPAHLTDPAQMRVWREAVKTTGAKVRDLRKRFPEIAHVIVNADWNLSERDPDNEHEIESLLDAGLHSSWGERKGGMPTGGTHAGRRVIDDTLTDADVVSIDLLPDDDSSDHRPYRVVLRLDTAPTPPAPTPGGSMKFVSREDWGATARGATPSSHPIGATKGITAHWEGPGMGGFAHSVCARKVRTIQRFHKSTRGWADIAYNAIVCPHGYVFEGRGPNVRSAANGWEQVNDDWYAVCYLGGVGDKFTEAGKKGFLDAFAWLARKGDAGPRRNGHRDHKQTACPGDEIYRWVHNLKAGAVGSTEEEDDMAWDEKYPAWGPDKNPDGDMPMDQQLQQARGYAQDAYRNAKGANTRAARIEDALKALAKALGPTVEDAVKAALAESVVDVDVTVHQPGE